MAAWNAEDIAPMLEASPAVALCIAGHDHPGGYGQGAGRPLTHSPHFGPLFIGPLFTGPLFIGPPTHPPPRLNPTNFTRHCLKAPLTTKV